MISRRIFGSIGDYTVRQLFAVTLGNVDFSLISNRMKYDSADIFYLVLEPYGIPFSPKPNDNFQHFHI